MQGELIRRVLALGGALLALSIAPTAFAAGAPCFNDTDCRNSACGGEVCNWNELATNPVGEKTFVCRPAGLAPQGADGWCTTDENCKCRAQGAKCIAPYCSFTQSNTNPSGAGGSTAGSTGSNISGSATTTSTAGASSGTSSTVDVPTAESDSNSSSPRVSRSCSVAPTPASDSFLLLPALGMAFAAARRRAKRRAP